MVPRERRTANGDRPNSSSRRAVVSVSPDSKRMELIIEPGLTIKSYWRDLWHYRELMYFLAWRDIAVRYKQTAIGVAWALIRPALTLLVFVGFRGLTGMPESE